MLQQRLNQALVINHFSNSDDTLVLHDRSFSLILACLHQEWHSDMEDFLHLGEDESHFVLQKRAALLKVLRQQSLANSTARIFRVQFPESEHSTISVEEAIVGVVEQYLRESCHVSVALIHLVVERRGRVVRAELEPLQVNALSLTSVCGLVPLDQVLGQLAGFKHHLGDVGILVSVALEQPNRVLVRQVSQRFYSLMYDDLGVVALDNRLEEGLDLGHMLRRVVHLSEAIANLVPQQITALLNCESLNQSIDRFKLLEAAQAEETVYSLGNRRLSVFQDGRVLV